MVVVLLLLVLLPFVATSSDVGAVRSTSTIGDVLSASIASGAGGISGSVEFFTVVETTSTLRIGNA